MSEYLPDAELDKIADDLIANGNQMVACSAQPTNYTEAHATYMLANVALAGGDYSKGAGTIEGRKVSIGAKSAVPVTNGGTGTHLAIIDTVNSLLKGVTTCLPISLSAGQIVNFPAWSLTIHTPTYPIALTQFDFCRRYYGWFLGGPI